MEDIQSKTPSLSIPIDRVGVKNFRYPIVVRRKNNGTQHTVAKVTLYVDLPSEFKGTHMSRFIEALQEWSGVLDYQSFKELLKDIQKRLKARKSHLSISFPFFMENYAPKSGIKALMAYECAFGGELEDKKLTMFLEVNVPVMTVCPCSLAICERGAHSQRANIKIRCEFEGLLWLEDLIMIARNSGSSPVYALLKRIDEKHVTEEAFANPVFVEDVVRRVAIQLKDHPLIKWFRVEVESFESIHNHNAYACIESKNRS